MKLIILAMVTLWLWTRYRRRINMMRAQQRLKEMKAFDDQKNPYGTSDGPEGRGTVKGPYLRSEPIWILDKDKKVIGKIPRR